MLRRGQLSHVWWPPLCALLLATLGACTPALEGSNQVNDINVELTIQKDSGLAARTWDVVDTYMTRDVVPDPTGPGCAIGIARGGELIYLQGYGRAVVGGTICSGDECVPLGGEAWGVGTMGAVGSVAKTFTAAAALRMHELGLLDVNRRVGAYLPTSNQQLARTPIFELLMHSSGVGGGAKADAFSPTWTGDAQDCVGQDLPSCLGLSQILARPASAFDYYHEDELVADLDENDPPYGTPSQGVYSNVGYSVAGALVDEIARNTPSRGYEAWIWDNLGQYRANPLDPDNLWSLALTHSWRADDIPHRAVGYRPRPDGDGFDVFEAWQDTGGLEGWEGPSGGWAMTIGDLTRFTVALNTRQIVGNAVLTAMRLPWAHLDDPSDDYGMGVFPGDGQVMPYWHGGVIGGHTAVWTWWDRYEQTGPSLAIAMICNKGGSGGTGPFPLRDHARVIASYLGTSEPRPRSSQALPGRGDSSVRPSVFALDRSGAWQVEPTGAVVPLALAHTALLHVTPTGRGLSFQLSGGAVRPGAVVPVTAPQALGVAAFSADPRFTTEPTDVMLVTTIGQVDVSDFVVEGAFSDRGMALTDVALTGVIDTRQAGTLLGRTSVCANTARGGGGCTPCADGVAACVTFRYEGIRGDRVTPP
jgi:CubicO group peptidase (beta-lactamase class C family)